MRACVVLHTLAAAQLQGSSGTSSRMHSCSGQLHVHAMCPLTILSALLYAGCWLQGLVKLADFGVAAKLGELDEQHNDELHQNVVGTPYWMAPEVRPVQQQQQQHLF